MKMCRLSKVTKIPKQRRTNLVFVHEVKKNKEDVNDALQRGTVPLILKKKKESKAQILGMILMTKVKQQMHQYMV